MDVDSQAYFKEHGCFPAKETAWKPPVPKAKKSSPHSTTTLRQGWGFQAALALRGWKGPSHWMVPPAFENPRLAFEILGLEAYKEAVHEYYAGIREAKVEKAKITHTKWAVRACLSIFETAVRGFRGQDVGRRGGIFGKSKGQEKFGEGRRAVYEDILTLPEELAADGRIMYDFDAYLKAYGVPEKEWAACNRLFKKKLLEKWGVRC